MTKISLGEMEAVKLMNRIDSKFMFHIHQLPGLLKTCEDHYSVMVIKNKNYSTYHTHYYDTPDYRFYNQHHAGKLNRYKIRIRKYLESELRFLEIKFKNNKGRTTKKRIKLLNDSLNSEASQFIETETAVFTKDLKRSIDVAYNRITLVNKNSPERVTIDINLTTCKDENKRSFNDLVIAEVKQDKLFHSAFAKLMRNERIKAGAISKYCLGISNLVEQVKKNNFKETNYKITKIINHGS